MQHTLLGIGLALIAAIVAALAAPLFVDWNSWRAEFEQRASALVNTPVTIKGPIEATILPRPAFALNDVLIGEAGGGTRVQAAQIRGELSLGGLLRGRLEADEVIFARPDIRVAHGADGKFELPPELRKDGAGNFSISRIALDAGAITIRGADGKETKYENVSGFGALQSRTGPFKFEFSATREGQGLTLRVSASEFREAQGKIRLAFVRAQDGIGFDADGNLALADARPRFEGKIGFSRRLTGAAPWKLAAETKADMASVALDQIELAFGPEEKTVEFAGSANINPRAATFEATLAAKRVDLDRFGTGDAKQDFMATLAPLRDALTQLSGLPLSGKISIAAENVVSVGAVVRDVKSELTLREGVISPQRFEARLPGLAGVAFAARMQEGEATIGALKLTAEEPAALARWLGIDRLGASFDDAALRLEGDLRISKNLVAIAPFALAHAGSKWSGSASYDFPAAGKAARIEAKLAAEKPDLAQIAALLSRGADASGLDIAVALDARSPQLMGATARRFDTAVSLAAGKLSIERMSLEDFDGLNFRARGELAAWRERPQGRVEIETEIARTGGLLALARAAAGSKETATALAKRIAAVALPVRMTGAVSGDGKGPELAIDFSGTVNAAQATITARVDLRSAAVGEAGLVAEAEDAAQLVTLLGLPSPEPHAGRGRLEATIGRPQKGAFPLKANLVFPGINLSGSGTVRAGADGGFEPVVDLQLAATDLRALSLVVARAANTVVPANGTARLVRFRDSLALEDIALALNDFRLRGRLWLSGLDRPLLSGSLSMNRAELPVLLALVLGRADESRAPWSDKPLQMAALENIGGTIDIESAALNLVGPYVANGARLKLRFAGNEAAIEEFSGELAGGKISGEARFARGNPFVVDGNLSLAGGDFARLMAPGAARAALRGRANASLQFTAQGTSPAALIANAAGRGNLAIEGFELDKHDPEAVLKLIPAPGAPPLSETEANTLLAFGLQKEPLRVARVEVPLLLNSGVVRAARTRATVGGVEVTSEAGFDLIKLDLDAAIGLQAIASPKNPARAEAVVRWRGPVADPRRSIDVGALITALSTQAIEAEMKKLEGRNALPPPAASPAAAKPVPRRRPGEVPPPAAAELPPLPPPTEIGPAPGNARPRLQ